MDTRIISRPFLSISVIIVTYNRPKNLSKCLDGVISQSKLPDHIIVVARKDDVQTIDVVKNVSKQNINLILVNRPGTVFARNAGCDACTTDLFAMLDDDAIPHIDWLERITAHFENDDNIGAVGGRDICYFEGRPIRGKASVVGKVQWYGRIIGNHHLGYGLSREIDVLRGVNMSYRTCVLAQVRFNERLRGSGAQPCEDKAFSLSVKKKGWKVIYDPLILVDHFEIERNDVRHYSGVHTTLDIGFTDFIHNEFISTWDFLCPLRRGIFLVWSILVGTAVCPGLVQGIRFTPSLGLLSWRRVFLAQRTILKCCNALFATMVYGVFNKCTRALPDQQTGKQE